MASRIGGLWLKQGRQGKFMSGEIEINGKKIQIVVFKNDKGDNPKRPDYTIHIPDKRETKREPEDEEPF